MSDVNTIARPYARAIFEIASEAKTLTEWSQTLKILAVIADNKLMQSLLSNPLITKDQLESLFSDVVGGSLNQEVRQLLSLLITRKRINLLPAIANIYEQFLAERDKTIDVKVVSAYPIDQVRLQKLQHTLQNHLNRKVNMYFAIDNSVLGGLVIYAGDKVIDGSLRNKLNQLAETMYS